MGVKGFFYLINKNQDKLCSAPTSIRGKLLVDGYSVLHELYDKCRLEWAGGGCYADQHKATVEFYEALLKARIEPIVVLNGTSTKPHILDTIERRRGDINSIPGELRKLHENSDSRDYRDHFLPLLSRHVYKASLKAMDKVQVFVSDGKSYELIVRLANHYGCPVLTNNTIYCVSNLTGGVIFMKYFNRDTCSAPVYEQKKLTRFLRLSNPDLICALVAFLGDGCDTSVSFLYHGPVRREVKSVCPQAESSDRPWVLNLVDYFNEKGIRSFHDLKSKVKTFHFGKLKQKLAENCLTVEEIFMSPPPTAGIEELIENPGTTYTSARVIPGPIVAMHRLGNYPDSVVTAMCEGKCILDVYVGDPEQDPVSKMGIPVRQIMYGLVRSKMEKSFRMGIQEYYRSDVPNEGSRPWEYSGHQILPVLKYEELSAENIYSNDERTVKAMAKRAIVNLLNPPLGLVQELSSEIAAEYLMAILVTQYWAQQVKYIGHRDRLIKSLVLNFFICPEKEGNPLDQFSDPQWIKVYHALLEWQALYRDVCNLNTMLFNPFAELHPNHLFYDTFVISMALNPNPEVISTLQRKMSLEKQHLYETIIAQLLD